MLRIELDDLSRPSVIALLAEHLRNMYELSPADQVFAFDASKLKAPDVSFWTVWNGELLLGCAALQELSSTQGEIKSMRTPSARRRTGVGRALLNHIIDVARSRGCRFCTLRPAAILRSCQPERCTAAQALSIAARSGPTEKTGIVSSCRSRSHTARPERDNKGKAMTVTIYHNPNCGTSRNVLAMIRQSGEEPVVIEYLKNPPTRERLKELIQAMGIPVRALLREKGTPYAELGLENPKWSDEQLLDFMMAHPILINRPIVVTPKGVKLCRPSETVLDLLPNANIGRFVKEDREVVEAKRKSQSKA